MRIRYVLLGMMLTLCLSGCGRQGLLAGDTADESATEAATETTADASMDILLADGYQFVRGVGICTPQNPVVYQMDSAKVSTYEDDTCKLALTDVIYQNQTLIAFFVLEDQTASLLEQETQEEQSEQTSVEDVTEATESVAPPRKSRATLHGEGILAKTGIASNSYQSRYSEEQYQKDGYLTAQIQIAFTNEKILSIPEPQGTYQLSVEGIETPFAFTLTRAKEYASLEEIPGMVYVDPVWIYANGVVSEHGLEVAWYTFAANDYTVIPFNCQVTGRDGSGQWEDSKSSVHYIADPPAHRLTGFEANHHRGIYAMPEGVTAADAELQIKEFLVTSREESGRIAIEIPEQEMAQEKTVAFRDSTLHLKRVKRLEPRLVGTRAEEDIYRPYIAVVAEVEGKTPDMALYGFGGAQETADGTLHDVMEFEAPGVVFSTSEGEGAYYEKTVTGFEAAFEEGAEALYLRLKNPSYLWKKEVTVPIQPETPPGL